MSTAPAISNIVASMQAWTMESTPAPTLVPKLLATSFAPMPKASTKATMNPTTTSQTRLGSYGTAWLIVALLCCVSSICTYISLSHSLTHSLSLSLSRVYKRQSLDPGDVFVHVQGEVARRRLILVVVAPVASFSSSSS